MFLFYKASKQYDVIMHPKVQLLYRYLTMDLDFGKFGTFRPIIIIASVLVSVLISKQFNQLA